MSKKNGKAVEVKKLKKAKVSLAEMMENLRPFLPDRQIYEPEPTREWRIAEECNTPIRSDREAQEADV
jgi:hypothetical protein